MNRVNKLLTQLDAKQTAVPPITSNTTANVFAKLSQQFPDTTNKLKAIFGDRYSENDKILEKYGRDIIGHKRYIPPNAVIFPISKQEIITLMQTCNNHKPPIAIIPHSAGTSLEAHTLRIPNRPSITLSFSKFNKLIKVYPSDMQCTIQPGMPFMKLNKLLSSKYNLMLGVDPAPSACIGGMLGTCCSGPSAIRYGTMRNQIINMTIVLSDGTVIKTGQRAVKSVAGYDLNGLFCGSEGTLGIVVEATVRLRVVFKYTEIAQALFERDDWHAIGQCVQEINSSGIALSAFEFMDCDQVNVCLKYDPKCGLVTNKNLILFKFAGPSKEHINADIAVIKKIVKQYSNDPFVWSSNEEQRHRLWNVRKNVFWAGKFANPGLDHISTDVAVPFSNFTECIQRCRTELNKSKLFAPIVGHIGDGNFHAQIFYNKDDEKQVKELKRLGSFIVNCALDLNGTCTAEHGVGKNKTQYLYKELGNNTVEFMKSLKTHCDPNNILCPGNVVDI